MTKPRASEKDAAGGLLLFVFALMVRIAFAKTYAREPVWDGFYYHFGAKQIASGFGYADGAGGRWHAWCHYPVGYSAFLAFFYLIFGSGIEVAPMVNSILGALVVLVVHQLGVETMGPWRGRLAALLVAVNPELISYSALLMTEPLASVMPLLAALIILRNNRRIPWQGWVLGGFVLGLGTLVRPQTLLCAPAVALLVFEKYNLWPSVKKSILAGVIATVSCLFVVMPWTIRNCRVMDGCVLVSTNAGWNLAIGAFERATGRFETLRATDGCPVVTGQVQQDRCWGELGVESIKKDPGRWFSMMPKKLSYTYDHASFPVGYIGETDKEYFTEERKKTAREWLTWAHGLLMMGACIGMLKWPLRSAGEISAKTNSDKSTNVWWRRVDFAAIVSAVITIAAVFYVYSRDDHPYWLLALLAPLLAVLPLPGLRALGPLERFAIYCYIAVSATHAVFFGEDRYHVVIAPMLALLMAGVGYTREIEPLTDRLLWSVS